MIEVATAAIVRKPVVVAPMRPAKVSPGFFIGLVSGRQYYYIKLPSVSQVDFI
jgi:hypothetical protein